MIKNKQGLSFQQKLMNVVYGSGSVWEIAAVDTVDSMLWLPTTNIIACDDKLINTEDNETVEATRLK
jgi:hypothetical protein